MSAIHGIPEARIWLFDFDNTLAALEGQVDWAASRRELEAFLRSAGAGEALFREFPTRNLPLYNALLMQLRAGDGSGVDGGQMDATALMERASAIIEAYELRGVERAMPLDGAISLLGTLHGSNKRVAVVTSNSSRTVDRWLAMHSLNDAVDVVVGRDSLLPLKPSSAMILEALERCAGCATEAVFVGDSEADLQAARQVGLGFFGVAEKAVARTRLAALGARDVLVSPAELAALLGFVSLSARVQMR